MLYSTQPIFHFTSYILFPLQNLLISTNEQITHDPLWASQIKPSLEKCHEVTCVGHSLGGALCNAFTMCANTGPEYLIGNQDDGMQDDYDAIAWTKKTISTKESSVEQDANLAMANE